MKQTKQPKQAQQAQQVRKPSVRQYLAHDPGGYIPGLDGLRAFAVCLVILYHISPAVFPGGFLGVDIFFVLSGFLITTLLVRELRKNSRIDLQNFWKRRIRRLLPALVFLVITVVPLALLTNKDLLVGIARQVLGALTFSTNWLEIAHGSSYFDSTTPLLFKNFWSLAIEEQFYVLWPLFFLLLLAIFRNPRHRLLVVASLGIASMIAMAVLYNPAQPTRVYYGTDTHVFGISCGIILALLWTGKSSTVFSHPHWVQNGKYYGYGALTLLCGAALFLPGDSAFAFRGGMQITALLVSALLASLLQPQSWLAKVGELRPVKWLGTRSYAVYLWHWPILVISGVLFPAAVSSSAYWIRSLLAVVVTGIICEFSYRYIENPVRTNGIRASCRAAYKAVCTYLYPKIIAFVIIILLVMTGIALGVAPEKSQTQLAIEKAEKEAAAVPKQNAPESVLDIPPARPVEKTGMDKLSPQLNTSPPAPEEVTAIGDSMFSAAKTGLDYALPGINLLAKSNRQWKDAPQVVAEGLKAGEIRRAVVISFGTNAGVTDPQYIHQVIQQLGPERMILLVNLYSPSDFIDSSNKALADIAQQYANVSLVDWHKVVYENPDLLQVDATHPSIAGANALGNLIKESLAHQAAELAALQNKTVSTP